MKYLFYKGKVAAAVALGLSLMLSTSAFAAQETEETVPAVEILTAEEAAAKAAQEEKELTLEEAVDMAMDNSAELRNVADTAEYLQELKEDIWDITGSFSVPTVSYQQWVDDDIYSIYSSIQTIGSNMTKNSYSREITKLTIEATVKNSFTSILSDESSLELAKQDTAVKKTLYEQGRLKNRLGLLSDYDLDTLRSDYEQAQYNVTKLEMALAQEYLSFYDLIGADSDAAYILIDDTEYEPYTMNQTMDQYINSKLNSDYTIKLQEQAVDDAEFNKNYLSISSTNATSATNENAYDTAKRSLKTAKDSKTLAIQNAYNTILSLESQHESARTALSQAEAAYRVAQINLEAGNTTAITVEQAKLAVEQAENAVRQLDYAHDMQIYQFENTELLSSSGSAQ